MTPARRLPRWRHLVALGAIALLSASLTWLVAEGPPPGNFLALKGRDLLFLVRHLLDLDPPVSDRLVLVGIDEVTLADPELRKPMATWSAEHAEVIRALTRAGAAVVALDFVQPNPAQAAEADVALAQALREAPAVLATDLDDSGALAPPNPFLFFAAGDPADAAGLIRNSRDEDGALRRASIVHEYRFPEGKEAKVLTLWFQGARRLLGLSNEDLVAAWQGMEEGRPLVLAGREVPLVAGAAGERPEYLLVNYAGPDGTFPRTSYVEVLRRRDDDLWLKAEFRGRLVFLGVTHPDMQDYHRTPMAWVQRLSGTGKGQEAVVPLPGVVGRDTQEADDEMAGTEILAHAANTLVTGSFLRLPGPLATWAWAVGLCFLGALAGNTRRFRVARLAVLLVGTVGVGFAVFVADGLVLPLAWPLAGTMMAFAGGIGWRHNTTDAERRRIRGLLGRYVSDQVADLVVRQPDEAALGGRAAEVTLLFSDLNHFTTWSEKTDPAEVVETMNEYFTAMEDVIFRHGGTLKQFVGDEIMVIFGAPFPQADAEEQAVRTALDMQKELERLGERWAPRGIPRLQAKIGIHRGRVVVGNVGSPRRTEYAAVGDAVNLASRVMGLTKGLGHMVLITDEVYQRVKDLVEVREFPPQPVKGREAAVKVWGLDGLKDASTASPPGG